MPVKSVHYPKCSLSEDHVMHGLTNQRKEMQLNKKCVRACVRACVRGWERIIKEKKKT